jgi:hypothetical protein
MDKAENPDNSWTETKGLTRSEVIAAINQEISDIEAENKRNGWSRRTLLAALGSLTWLAIGEFNSHSNIETIGMVFLW